MKRQKQKTNNSHPKTLQPLLPLFHRKCAAKWSEHPRSLKSCWVSGNKVCLQSSLVFTPPSDHQFLLQQVAKGARSHAVHQSHHPAVPSTTSSDHTSSSTSTKKPHLCPPDRAVHLQWMKSLQDTWYMCPSFPVHSVTPRVQSCALATWRASFLTFLMYR